MPTENQRNQTLPDDATSHEDEPIPRASDDKVIEDTARLARDGKKELAEDPKERKAPSE